MTWRNHQPYRVIVTFILVDLHQPLAKRVNGYTHDGIGLWIERRPAAQGFHRDCVFLDVLVATLKMLFTYVLEDPRKIVRATEDPGAQEPLIFLPLGFHPRFCLVYELKCIDCCHRGILRYAEITQQ